MQRLDQMSQSSSISDEDINLKETLEFLSEELFGKKQLKTINMYGGKGGFGLVLFVEEVENPSKKYAIKAQPIININTGKINQKSLKMCKDEAEMLRKCKNKNVVEIYSDYELGFYHFIQMDLCKCSLDDWITNNKTQFINDVLFLHYTNQIIDGLDYLHNLDYVLRDLSIRNILLTTEGILKLCDFGLAKKYDDSLKSKNLYTQSAKGVFFYYPPELYEDLQNNKELTKQTKKGDIWALGVCLSLLGGVQIMEYLHSMNSNFQIPNSPNISSKGNQLIKFILNKNPEERPTIKQIREKICEIFFSVQNEAKETKTNQLANDQNNSIINSGSTKLSSSDGNQNTLSYQQLIENIDGCSINKSSNSYQQNKIERKIDFQFKSANQLLQEYENLLEIYPNNNDILITLGFIEVQFNSNIEKANQYFRKALQNNKNDIDAYIGLCECFISLREENNYKQGLEYLKDKMETHSSYWRLQYYLSYLYYLEGQQSESEQYLNEAVKLNQNEPLILSLQALFIYQNEKNEINKEKTLQLLEKSHNLNVNNHPDVITRRGFFFSEFIKDLQKGLSCYKQIADLGVKQLITYRRLLYTYNEIQDIQQYNLYKKILLEQFPDSYFKYKCLGCYESDKKEKMMYFEKAIQMNPQGLYCIEELEKLVEEQDIQKIINYYQKAIETNPQHIDTYLCFGDLYLNKVKDDIKALEYYQKANEIEQNNINVLFKILKFYERQKDYLSSLKICHKYLEIEPTNELRYVDLSYYENELGCFKKSIQFAKKGIEICQKEYRLYLNQGIAYFENKQFEESIIAFEKLLQLSELDNITEYHYTSYLNMGKAEYYRKNYSKAQDYLKISLTYDTQETTKFTLDKCQFFKNQSNKTDFRIEDFISPLKYFLQLAHNFDTDKIRRDFLNEDIKSNSLGIFEIGKFLYEYKKESLSIEFFEKVIKKDPKYSDAYYYLGKLSNQIDLKINYFKKYLETYQRNIEVLQYLAENTKNSLERIKYYEQLIEIEPTDISSLLQFCKLCGDKNENQKLKYLKEILNIDSNNQQGLTLLSDIYFNQKEFQKAKKLYQILLLKEPNSFSILSKLGDIDQELNKFNESNDYFRKAFDINPEAGVSYKMGMNHYKTQEYKKSLKRFFKCIQADKTYAKAYLMIGDIYLNKQDKKEDSIGYLREAINNDKSLEDAYYHLAIAFRDIKYIYEAVNCFEQLLKLNANYKEAGYCKKYIEENEFADVKKYKDTKVDTSCNIF